MFQTTEKSWQKKLQGEYTKPYYIKLQKAVIDAYNNQIIYPAQQHIFVALDYTPLPTVKVVILGQDPYHGGQAQGLAFSVPKNISIPPSLKNIYTEIQNDIGHVHHNTGDLTPWTKQGVLLLNSTLTVEAQKAGSHRALGWEQFTDQVITTVSTETTHTVFLLWGTHAKAKKKLIDTKKHLVLTAPHPSPLSAYRGFFGCTHFSQTNKYLTHHKRTPITW